MSIDPKQIFWRELGYRKLSFVLGVLAVSCVATCLIGSKAFLAAHDTQTEHLTEGLETRATERMTELRDAARRFSKNLGFNCMLLPAGQALTELYQEGKSNAFFSEAEAALLVDMKPETVNHLRPILRERTQWPEVQKTIVLVGVRGQIYIKAPRWQKPIEEAIDPNKAHVGFALAQDLALAQGSKITFMGERFTVEHILPQAGNEDDISIRIDLETAQTLLDHPDKISAILGLMCNCADGDPNVVRKELETVIPGIQVVDFTTRVRARQNARNEIAQGAKAEVEDIQASRAELRRQIAALANALVAVVTAGTMILLGVLSFNNAREREGEVALLKALGLSSGRIICFFLFKAGLAGLIGGILGCPIAIGAARQILGPSAVVSTYFLLFTVFLTIAISILSSILPALRAATQDPCRILNQE